MNQGGQGESSKHPAGEGQPVIVLAAGHGRRMGGPKVFAGHKGRGFLQRILERCHESRARVILVVDPNHRQRLEALFATLPAGLLAPLPRMVEADGKADMLASVQAALAHGPYEPGFWLWPVDAPFISAKGWHAATQAVARDPGVVWKLRVRGRTGHPVWFPFHVTQPLREGHWPDGLRGFLATLPPERIQILPLEGEFLEDVNTPQQLAGLDRLD